MTANGADTTDWKSEAKFWQTRYLEQCMHNAQVIAMLSRPLLAENALSQLATRAAAKKAAQGQPEASSMLPDLLQGESVLRSGGQTKQYGPAPRIATAQPGDVERP
jgi:hypothetical protein